ncbi:MAG: hypothetical protein V1924_00850 [Candidatus Bathyarchaeota archaeon]
MTTRKLSPQSLREIEEGLSELRRALDLAQAAVDEERQKWRRGGKHDQKS